VPQVLPALLLHWQLRQRLLLLLLLLRELPLLLLLVPVPLPGSRAGTLCVWVLLLVLLRPRVQPLEAPASAAEGTEAPACEEQSE
jgi:hypothetical protein